MPKLKVDDVELNYEERGSGPAVVFSHGLLWSLRMYDEQVAALSGRYRCIAFDHRGQGGSGTSPGPYDMERLADDAAALIEQLKAAPCHFVGLSMGGFVGLRLAARRPELLRSLVLIDTAADAEPRWNVPKYRAMSFISRILGYRVLKPAIMKIMFAQPFLRDPARAALRQRMEEHLVALPPDRTDAALDAVIRRRPVEDELARIRTPTLVLHGAGDSAIVPTRAKKMGAAIGPSRYVEIPRAGHSSTIEEPDAINRELVNFFSTLR